MSEIVTNPYNGEILAIVADTIETFGITAEKLMAFVQSDFWSKTLIDYEEAIDSDCFNHCLEQWLENN